MNTTPEDVEERREHTCTMFLIDQLLVRKLIDRDHHFHGVQLITMRKMFLNPVAVKIGMLGIRDDDSGVPPKSIPMRDTDYLRVTRRIKSIVHLRLIREVCDEDADPNAYYRIGSDHSLRAAFDALVDADEKHMEERCREEELKNTCNEARENA